VSFTGDLGWELYVAESDQVKLYTALLKSGEDLGVCPVGSRALLSLRVEKGYGSWGREYSPEYWPQEVGLDRLIKMDKPDFLGKAAYAALADRAPREKLVMIEVEADIADASGGEPIFLPDGTPVGRVSSGAFGYSVGKSLALGFIKTSSAVAGTEVLVAILGRDTKAVILAEPPFDPNGERLRG
jgi:dimethylglycine dehydrogenase